MDVAELKARFAEIAASLSQSVGEDATALALLNSQNLLISTLLEMFATLSEQNKAQQEQNEKLNSTIVELQETIKELRRQIGKNSNNSSKPPSSDGFKKQPRSLRKKSGNKVGAQHGHAGKNLSIPHAPDEVREHLPEKCNTCPHLRECVTSGQVFECGGSRYVIEAELSTRVIEHQIMRAVDCRCGESSLSGEFPQGVKAHVQYGDSVTVLCGLLSTYGAVSIKRIHVLLSGCLGVSISTGTISARVERCAKQVGGTMDKVFELLTRQGVIHFDETGLRVGGKLHWVHNSSTEDYTYQSVNSKRGMDGIEDNGVLPKLEQAIAVHDCWSSYWKYDKVEHAVCCAHLLRELESVKENEPNQQWAPQFTELLLEMKKAKETAIGLGKTRLERTELESYERRYAELMALADRECSAPPELQEKKRGRRKKGPVRALIERLKTLKDSVCLFVHNFAVPCDNNQAERDVRNIKTKAKVSGCFRSKKGAENYTRLMSYISTGQKHGISAYKALTEALCGNADIILG